MMDERQFRIIDDKLERALRLLALNLVRDAKGDDQIRILAAASFSPTEISDMLGKKRNAVNQALHRIKQGSERGEQGVKAAKNKNGSESTAKGGEENAK